ncbi:MAG: PhzF family phenazine biosynthesis protein [Pseudobdellovibrionaceae bacterium]
MRKFPFYWIDAFANQKLGGNPCAVILNADSLSSDEMQKIAQEMNLSETAFVLHSDNRKFAARYFTPQEELPFAGHPTVAVAQALAQAGLLDFPSNLPIQISLKLPAGLIPVEVRRDRDGSSQVQMSQLAPQFKRIYDPQQILPIYGLSVDDLLPGAVIQTVSTGSPVLMIPLKDHASLRKVKYMDGSAYDRLKAEGDFLFPHHFVLKGATENGATFARSLGTPPNTLEDPFTGSATGCMAAYLWKYGLISKTRFVAEQGHWMGRPGCADVEVILENNQIQSVLVTGTAQTIIEGSFSLD